MEFVTAPNSEALIDTGVERTTGMEEKSDKLYCGIPIRNIWLLTLYASDLFSKVEHERKQQGQEALPDDIPDIIAEILVHFVKERLMRGLSRRSHPQKDDLPRVRGSINMLRTESHKLLDRGLVACRFHEPTLNTPCNRLIRAALQKGSHIVTSSNISKKCRDYATIMYRMGVIDGLPTRNELSKEVYNMNNKEDRYAIDAAHLLLNKTIPSNLKGNDNLLIPNDTSTWLQKLFEHAIRGFYCVVADEWTVKKTNHRQYWPVTQTNISPQCQDDIATCTTLKYLPQMELDIVLIRKDKQKKIVIDTKFTSLLKKGWCRDETLSSAYIYQMYAYLRSQEDNSDLNKMATGILLHPAIDSSSNKSPIIVEMQGHKFIFATVNLNATASEIRAELLALLDV